MPDLSPPAADLYRQLQAFAFDPPDGGGYTQRLAAENSWSSAHTARVIEEYRRFLVLAAVTREPISPSDDVDQAWHLHLLYSRSYWLDLCEGLLGRPLHHKPLDRQGRDRAVFLAQYERTLDAYRRVFGEAPPTTIWPSPVMGFAAPVPGSRRRRRERGAAVDDQQQAGLLDRRWAAGAGVAVGVVVFLWLLEVVPALFAGAVVYIATSCPSRPGSGGGNGCGSDGDGGGCGGD